jgi:transcriptional regulator with XRE-family HTH domain
MSEYTATAGRVLRELRRDHSLKQVEAAEVLGIRQSAYSKLERGESVLNIE